MKRKKVRVCLMGTFVQSLLFLVMETIACAQRARKEEAYVWYSQSLSIPLSKQWAIVEDASLRWYGLNRNVSFIVVRGSLERKIDTHWGVGVGYAFFDQFRDQEGWIESRREQRPHLQVTYRRKGEKFQWLNRFRGEERFFSEPQANGELLSYHYARLRYMMALQVAPFRQGWGQRFYGTLQSEIMIHAGDAQYVRQSFDQYRLYPFVGYQLTQGMDFQVGYMFYYQINPANTQEVLGHTLRFSLICKLPERKDRDRQ